MTAPTLLCDFCPAPAMAVTPGSEPIHELFLLARGERMRCWCLAHWLAAFGVERAA